jgi:hypothetical protein
MQETELSRGRMESWKTNKKTTSSRKWEIKKAPQWNRETNSFHGAARRRAGMMGDRKTKIRQDQQDRRDSKEKLKILYGEQQMVLVSFSRLQREPYPPHFLFSAPFQCSRIVISDSRRS